MFKIYSFLFLFVFCSISKVFPNDLLKVELDGSIPSFQVNSQSKVNLKFSNITTGYSVIIDSVLLVNPKVEITELHEKLTLTLLPGETYNFEIKLEAIQNLTYKLVYFTYYSVPELKQSFVEKYTLNIPFLYKDTYDSFTQNLKGLGLKSALKNYVANHKSYTYKDARTYMFANFDNVDGWVECVYTGEKIQTDGIPDVNTTHFNNEHTWPQSKGADNEPEKSDLYHMYPTNEYANAKRGDYPFGNVISNIIWQVGNSKLGNDKNGNIRFEPRDVHKGNVARSMFYFAIRYNNPYSYLNSQEEALRAWMNLDKVDAREMKRNDDIASIQGKRNPFIDHPEFLDRIFSISTDSDFPQKFNTYISQSQVDISTLFLEKKLKYDFYITNTGNSDIRISNVQIENPDNDGIIESLSPISNYLLPEDSTLTLELSLFENSSSKNQNSILIINTEKGEHYEIPFKEKYYNSVSKKELDLAYLLSPNPTSDKLTISEIPYGAFSYEIYDYLGLKVQLGALVKEIDISFLSVGVYFLKLNNYPPLKFIKI